MPLDFVITIISSATVSATLTGLLLWLTKAWIGERLKNAIKAEYDTKLESHKAQLKAEYDTQLETHKAQLKSQSDVELERLKSSLAITAAQQNTTFTKLHDRRMDVISNTFARLSKLHDCVTEYAKPIEATGERPRAARREDTVAAFDDFKPYFSQNRLFLPERISVLIDNLNLELVRITNRFTYMVDLAKTPNLDEWGKITEKLESEFQQALSGLERELRAAIGDRS